MAIRVLIADSQPQKREQLRALLTSDPDIEIAGMARDGHEALQLAHQLRPDVALLAADLAVQDGFQTIEFLAAAPDLKTVSILMSEEDTPTQLRRAMRAGAREYFVWPTMRFNLVQMVQDIYAEQQRRTAPAFAEAAEPGSTARVIAVGGAKGGIGKTTITVNLALALAQETGEPTVLLDMYTQFGDIATTLNIEPRRTLMDLIEMGEQTVDSQLLEYCMETHATGLRVLTTSKTPVALDSISAPFLDTIIGLLKQQYRYIVMDVPLYLHPGTLHAFAHASNVLMISNRYDITTINSTHVLLDTLIGKYVDRRNIAIVLSRIAGDDTLNVSDIEQALGCPIIAQIPNDGIVVPRSINEGIPFMLSNPTSPVAQSIRRLAQDLAQTKRGVQETPDAPSVPGPISRLFGGLLGRTREQRKVA